MKFSLCLDYVLDRIVIEDFYFRVYILSFFRICGFICVNCFGDKFVSSYCQDNKLFIVKTSRTKTCLYQGKIRLQGKDYS